MAGPLRRGVMQIAVGIAAALLFGCETERDPRAGGFIDGVTNLSTGGYRDYVKERQDDLKNSQDRANILEARARSITAEREELERELKQASDELTGLQKRLADLQENLTAKRQMSADQRRQLDEADRRAKFARKRVSRLRAGAPQSVEAQRQSIADLKSLIGSVGAMVQDLSR